MPARDVEAGTTETESDETRSRTGSDEDGQNSPPVTEKTPIQITDQTTDVSSPSEVPRTPVYGDPTDLHLVGWNGPDDPANPLNWSETSKMLNITLVSLSALYTNIATTMFAPGARELAAEFGVTNNVVETLTITIPSLGASAGPLLFAPLSELTGRVPIYWASSIIYLACTAGCARSDNAAEFLVFRFLCGACSAAFMTCGGGTIADLLPKEKRGAATAMFTAGPLFGPIVGPVVGGFVVEALGWRWTFYLVLIMAAVITAVSIVAMRETNATIILSRKAARLRKETGNPELRSILQRPQVPAKKLIQQAMIRPMRMLIFSPIVMLMGLYMALVFGLTYLLFATFPSVFADTYGWNVGVTGLSYLGLGLGCVIGVVLFSKLSDRHLTKDGGPERRLLLMIWGGPCVPISLFWYGWSANYQAHWIVPIIGTIFIGVGTIFVTASAQLYMMDMFGSQGAASALAATTLVRNGSGAFLALAANPLYSRFGLGWGNSVLGFVSFAFLPVPVLFYKFGSELRERFPLNP